MQSEFGPRTVIGGEFARLGAERVVVFGSWAARHHSAAGPPPHIDGMTWSRGGATVERLIAAALLQFVKREIESNPEAAYVLAHDAARKAGTALLAHKDRGPRWPVTTSRPNRSSVPSRSEIEYPQRAGDEIETTEGQTAIVNAEVILAATTQVLPQLTLFRRSGAREHEIDVQPWSGPRLARLDLRRVTPGFMSSVVGGWSGQARAVELELEAGSAAWSPPAVRVRMCANRRAACR